MIEKRVICDGCNMYGIVGQAVVGCTVIDDLGDFKTIGFGGEQHLCKHCQKQFKSWREGMQKYPDVEISS